MYKQLLGFELFSRVFVIILIAVIIACNRKNIPPSGTGIPINREIWEKDYLDSVDYDIIKANTIFAFDLFSNIDKTKNSIISPYSISSSMAMVYAGSKYETQLQFSRVLHFSFDKSQIYMGFKALNEEFTKSINDDPKQIYLANSLWAQEKYSFLDPYFEICKKNFNSGFQYTDFINQHEKSRIAINQWVEDNTFGKIKNILPESSVDKETRLILVNALYFNGLWQIPFDAANTKKLPFYFADGSKKSTHFMVYPKGRLHYLENDSLQILEIPYQNNKFSMLVILPKNNYQIESQLKNNNYNYWLKLLRSSFVEVFLPRFSLNGNIDLSKTLISMGLTNAFNENADFSEMTGERNLKLDAVYHNAFIDVREKGTTAGASTAAVIKERTSSPEKICFRADHPFVFIIKDNNNGSILFIGRVINPELKSF